MRAWTLKEKRASSAFVVAFLVTCVSRGVDVGSVHEAQESKAGSSCLGRFNFVTDVFSLSFVLRETLQWLSGKY